MRSALHLGRKPRPPHLRAPRLADHLRAALPPAPPTLDAPAGAVLRMYGNDSLGDCTYAGLANLASIQSAREGLAIAFTDDEVTRAYLAHTGGRDEGAVEIEVLREVQAQGFPGDGSYRLLGFAGVAHGDQGELRAAAAAFGGLYLGVDLPLTAQSQAVWDVDPGPDALPGSWGGHCLILGGYDAERVWLATWGTWQPATWAWLATYCSESYALLDAHRALAAGVDVQGLQAELAALQSENPS